MHVLLVTSSTDTVGSVRRIIGRWLRGTTTWTTEVLGTEDTLAEIEAALMGVPSKDLAPYDAIILIGVHGMAHRTIYTIARQIIEREYAGRLIAIAKKDDLPAAPSEARRNFRAVGVRDDQFAHSLEGAIRMLNS